MKFGRTDYDGNKARIPADEPIFLLRAQDKFAADVVRFYANLVASHGGSNELCGSALHQAAVMEEWPKKKSPDLAK